MNCCVKPSLSRTSRAKPSRRLGAIINSELINEIAKLKVTNLGLLLKKLKYHRVADE